MLQTKMITSSTLAIVLVYATSACAFLSPTSVILNRYPSVTPTAYVATYEPTLKMSEKEKVDFWDAQRDMATEMAGDVVDKDAPNEKSQRELYEAKSAALVSETFYFSILIFSALWFLVPNPFTPISYFFGASLGTAYSYGLGKYVQTLGGTLDDANDVQGAGVGSARFAFLILLILFVGKFRYLGLQEIPSIAGFFTYQLSSLSQGLKDDGQN